MTRTGTAYLANTAPEVKVAFFDITITQIGGIYSNYVGGGLDQRLIYINTTTEPYTGKGTIHLLNQDHGIGAQAFMGCLVKIDWNWHGGTPSTDEPYWVTGQRNISQEGKLIVELSIANAWEMMQHSNGLNVAVAADLTTTALGSTRQWKRSTTVLNIISSIITSVGSFLQQWGLGALTTLAAEPAGAFAIQTYQPYVLTRIGEDDRSLLVKLLQMSHSALTFRSATGATLNYIDPATPGPYTIYDLAGTHEPFFIHVHGQFLTIPNRIIFADIEPDLFKNQVSNFVGFAQDVTSENEIGQLPKVFYDPSIGFPHSEPPTAGEIVAGNLEADARAAAMLARLISQADKGEIFVPMNCTAELYDEVQIVDPRSTDTVIGRISRIERTFKAIANSLENPSQQREEYSCHIFLGGIGGGSLRIQSFTGENDVDASARDMATRGTSNPFIDTPQIPVSTLSQHYAPERERRPATGITTLNNGAVHVVPGATITTPIVQVVSEARVDGQFAISGGGGAAAGDTVLFYLYLDGVQYGMAGIFQAGSALDAKTIHMTWIVPIINDGLTHLLALTAQRTAGAGTWVILTNNSDIIMELSAGKNTRLF